jgi:ABC-2 type transport system ATP-binding protein
MKAARVTRVARAPRPSDGHPPQGGWGLSGVSVRYGHHLALVGVTLRAVPGRITAVVGGDGAGKTTLLRCAAGALAPSSGQVSVPGIHQIGYLSPSGGIYPDLTVEENLSFRAAAFGLPPARARARVAEHLDRTGLTAAHARLAGDLSGGMRKKLGVIAAMLPGPALLVLDEPTTGVDPVSRADLWWLIAQAAAGGAAVLFSTTYLDEAQRAAHVLVLDAGRPLASGTPAEIAAAMPGVIRAHGPGRHPPSGGPPVAPLAECASVTRTFGPVVAVDHVDLRVSPGEVVGLLGANGAGKTTLIRMLLGLLRTSSGQVRLFGQPPSRLTRRRIGYVPQGLGLYDDLTVAQNLEFARAVFGAAVPPAPELPAALRPFADTEVGELPLGVSRRVAFTQALAHRPDLLILDEPTSGVDPLARARLWETIHDAAEAGAGVIVTTHYMEEAEECTRLVVMAAGRVVAEGTSAGIVGDRRTVVVDSADWPAALRLIEAAGLRATLTGTTLRVPGVAPATVERALAGVPGAVPALHEEAASLEERFFELAAAPS